MSNITLTIDQQNALDKFVAFLMDPLKSVFVIEGYAGTGKSTLIKTLIEELPKYYTMMQLIDPDFNPLDVVLTATTNKAAEAFSDITGLPVKTVHSHLNLRVSKDFKTGVTRLVKSTQGASFRELLFIDEASSIDGILHNLINEQTDQTKIVYIGDRAQIIGIKANSPVIFFSNYEGTMLENVVRQAEGNPIIAMATGFRNAVNTGNWNIPNPDGKHIIHLSKEDFENEIVKEFTRSDWHFNDSKVLAWTNACVNSYNQGINEIMKGDPHFVEGDYAINNHYTLVDKKYVKTDERVKITKISQEYSNLGVMGFDVTINNYMASFLPSSLQAKKDAITKARSQEMFAEAAIMEDQWFDLRPEFAQTVDKSQGSTYDKVFIDVGDIGNCTNANRVARMLYVAVSRARHKVYLTGDL